MTRSTKVFLWVLVVLLLIVLAGIVTGAPVPPRPKKPKVRVSDSLTSQGSGAAALIAEPVKVVPPIQWRRLGWDKHPTNEAYVTWYEGTNLCRATNYTVIETKYPGQDWTVWWVTNELETMSPPFLADKPWQLFRARGEWKW